MLHGAFVAALVFTAFAFKKEAAQETTKIFELVAGDGNNWAATEATALGSPEGIKFQPTVAPPQPAPVAPPQPEPVTAPPVQPSPVVAVAPEPSPVTAPKVEPKKTTPPPKTFVQQIQQVADRKEKQVMTKHRRAEAEREKKEAAAEAKRKAAAAAEAKRMSYDEFSKTNSKKVASNTKSGASSSYEKVSAKGLATGVNGGSTDKAGAGGPALSRAEQDQLATYFTFLKQKVKEAHVTPIGVTNQPSARVSFHVSASGVISQVKIIRSSGNAEFDQSVITAFRAVGSIGSRPDGRGDVRESEFNMRDTD